MLSHRFGPRFRLTLLFLASALLAVSGCSIGHTSPNAAPSPPNPSETFAEALQLVGKGDLEALLALRPEPSGPQTIQILENLYGRYGEVERIYPVAFNQLDTVSRGVFVAAHQGGPFVWDLVIDDGQYTMVRGSTDLEPWMARVDNPSADALKAADRFLAAINAGEPDEIFPYIVCGCIAREGLHQQVEELLTRGGAEERRLLVGTQSVPGMEDTMLRLTYLSRRQNVTLGFHLLLWKTDDAWQINAVHWAPDELLGRP
jgi:hypothetical protein